MRCVIAVCAPRRRADIHRTARRPRRKALRAGAMLALAAISGCAQGQRFRPEQLSPGESVIYVYRKGAAISPGPIDVVIDQNRIASLGPSQYVATIVAPGEHLVRVQRRSSATRRVTLGPGESVLFEGAASLLGGRVTLEMPGEEVARERIANAREVTARAAPQPE